MWKFGSALLLPLFAVGVASCDGEKSDSGPRTDDLGPGGGGQPNDSPGNGSVPTPTSGTIPTSEPSTTPSGEPTAGTTTSGPTTSAPTALPTPSETSGEPSPNPTPAPTDTTQPEPTSPDPTATPNPTGPSDTTPTPSEPVPAQVACDTPEEDTFTFFLLSYEAIIREASSLPDGDPRKENPEQGLGGDLGGIAGADAICARAALTSSSCAGNKTWRAFLSTSTEDAVDRIGTGPWHDRIGRILAANLEDLLNDGPDINTCTDGRPIGSHPEIINDFPNEFGVSNRFPGPPTAQPGEDVDNHQILTGSGCSGRLWTQDANPSGGGLGGFGRCSVESPPPTRQCDTLGTTCTGGWEPEKATCRDWTSSEPWGCPRVGHSWPRDVGDSGRHWISVWNEGGCAPGVELRDIGGLTGDPTVGSAGGYGGFYCFAVTGE